MSQACSCQEWEWGAVLLALITALPHMAVHQEKRHLWVEEELCRGAVMRVQRSSRDRGGGAVVKITRTQQDVRGAVHKGSLNCCKNTFVACLHQGMPWTVAGYGMNNTCRFLVFRFFHRRCLLSSIGFKRKDGDLHGAGFACVCSFKQIRML